MKNSKVLSLQIAGAMVLATMSGTSAFAESRHLGGTRGSSHSFSPRSFSPPSFSRSAPRFSGSRPSFSRPSCGGSAPRFESRGGSRPSFSRPSVSRPSFGGSAPRYDSRNYAGRSSGRGSGSRGSSVPRSAPRVSPSWRGSRGPSVGRSTPFHGYNYNDGHRFHGQGRISRISPYHGGYRIWLGGWGYPFFVPYRFYDPFRFRLGLFIGLNAFYDPLGYYTVYGGPGYAYPPVYSYGDGYRDDGDSATYVRGTVQSVDLQSGIVVINDDASRRQVSALLPPRDNRVDDIRPGDYIELSGDWVRGRRYEFDADRLERFDPRR